MPTFELAALTTNTAAGGASVEVLPSTLDMNILEIGVFAASATANALTLGQPGNTPQGGTVVNAARPTDLSSGTASTGGIVLTGWTTAPTVPSSIRTHKVFGTSAIGAGVTWTWEPGMFVLIPNRNLALILWQSANSPQRFYVKWTE